MAEQTEKSAFLKARQSMSLACSGTVCTTHSLRRERLRQLQRKGLQGPAEGRKRHSHHALLTGRTTLSGLFCSTNRALMHAAVRLLLSALLCADQGCHKGLVRDKPRGETV